MTALTIALTAAAALVVLIWSSRHLMINKEKRTGFELTDAYADPEGDQPRISVVVAAKDEAVNIESCVRSMLNQDYDDLELVVCNDRSDDATGEIVEKIANIDTRCRLINIDHLPEGWGGKNHAMQHGIATTDGQWICMTDADCRQTSPRTLAAALRYAQDTGADLLSVLPKLETHSFWESVVQPVCSGVMMIWFHPDKVNSPRHKNAYANGAFMLIKRSAYEAIGTHEAVRGEVNEDMHMAERVKSSGLNLRVVRNDGLYSCRMYDSLGQIFNGWSRIFYGTFSTARRILLSMLVLFLVSLYPWIAAGLGLSLAAAGLDPQAGWWALGLTGALATLLQLSVIGRFYHLIHADWRYAPLYPLGGLIALCCLIRALGKLRKGAKIVWRNTSYASGTVRK